MHDDKYCFFVAVDAVVFTVIDKKLKVLLITNKFPPFQHHYALPGGRVYSTEDLDTAVSRELFEETNVRNVFLKKFNAYGAIKRDPRSRVVSVAYLALIDADMVKLHARSDAESAQWVAVETIKKLAYDHDQILADALDALRFEVQTTNIAAQLLPEKFTLTDLQLLYEHVLGKSLDKRNFRKRVADLDILVETKEQRIDGAHRPATLYRFRTRKYQPLKDRISVFT